MLFEKLYTFSLYRKNSRLCGYFLFFDDNKMYYLKPQTGHNRQDCQPSRIFFFNGRKKNMEEQGQTVHRTEVKDKSDRKI